jgi:hypothetical protein
MPGVSRPSRTQAQRYTEAVRATHLIANELADIEEDSEFDKMLAFVLQQWRDVRQRLRIPARLHSSATESRVNVDDAAVQKEFDISSSEEDRDDVGTRPDAEEGSLQTSALGSSVTKIRLNPKARKVGRPKLQKKKTVAGGRVDRKWYEAAESGRKQSGEVTLEALLDALDRDKPGLVEFQRRLAGILVKNFGEAENKKPKYKRKKNPVLVIDPFYMLPPKLLDACLSVFPCRTRRTARFQSIKRRRRALSQMLSWRQSPLKTWGVLRRNRWRPSNESRI